MIAWIRSKIAPPTVATQARLALLLLIAQGGITVTGSIVRVTGSGLGCDTWPLCNEGSLVPVRGATPWVHQLIEFGNRLLTFVLVAAVVAVLVACLAAYRRKEIITHVVIQGLGVIVQAIIGGISVRLDLKWWSVAIHFLPSMLLVWLAAQLYLHVKQEDASPRERYYSTTLRALYACSATMLAAVLITGTMVTGAGPHSGDSGVGMEGRLQVDIAWIAHVHAYILYAYLAVLVVLLAFIFAHRASPGVKKMGVALIVVIVVQSAVGIMQYRLGVPRWTVPIHIGLSSVVVAVCSMFYALGYRRPWADKGSTGSVVVREPAHT